MPFTKWKKDLTVSFPLFPCLSNTSHFEITEIYSNAHFLEGEQQHSQTNCSFMEREDKIPNAHWHTHQDLGG